MSLSPQRAQALKAALEQATQATPIPPPAWVVAEIRRLTRQGAARADLTARTPQFWHEWAAFPAVRDYLPDLTPDDVEALASLHWLRERDRLLAGAQD